MARRHLLGSLGALAAAGGTLALAHRRARSIPFSPVRGDGSLGDDWADRTGLRGLSVAGEMDSLDTYARPGFDPAGVHSDVRALYERTSEFEMTLDATWHHPFKLGARVATRLTSRLEQLNLPGPGAGPKRLESDLSTLADHAARRDPRDDPRLWIRTTPDGEGVFLAIYASYVREQERLVNIAVPLPKTNLSTVLRFEHEGDGLRLTTDCPDGGLYLQTAAGAFRLPASQVFRVLPAGDPAAPAPPGGLSEPATVLASQRIRLCGLPLVTIRYAVTM